MKDYQKKHKLLFYIDSMNFGGAERVTANLANHWATEGWEIIIVTLAPQSTDSYDLHPAVKRISLELASDSANSLIGIWQNLRRVAALRRVLRQTKPNIALGIMDTANIILALAARGLPDLRTIGAERNYPPQQPLNVIWEFLRRYCYGCLHAVTAQTAEAKSWIEKHTHSNHVTVIPNAVTWPLPKKEPHRNPSLLLKPNRYMLLAVGRLTPQKGFDGLINAFAQLANNQLNWDLVIIGEGELRPMLETQVLALGLQGRIFLPGHIGNIGEWYESAGLLVLSSNYEGFPNVLAEAMAYGLATVSFDCDTGPRDIIRHQIDGLLVSQGNLAELAKALDFLMTDHNVRKQYAHKAMEVRERFSMPKIVSMWETLFNETLTT